MKGGNLYMAIPFALPLSLGDHEYFLSNSGTVNNVHRMCHIPKECISSAYTVHRDSSLGQEGEGHVD